MKRNTKIFIALAITYFLLVFAPYFIPALNSATPQILGFPFTVVYIILVILYGCGILYWSAKHVWKSFDEDLKAEEASE